MQEVRGAPTDAAQLLLNLTQAASSGACSGFQGDPESP